MDDEILKQIARQLRQPQGEAGAEIGQRMNVGNDLINRRAIAQLAVQPHDQILELGPGNGFFACDIVGAKESVRYVGCDISGLMVEQANLLNTNLVNSGQAQFMERTGVELPFPDASFTKCLTINTLYFWEDPAPELAEIRRVLVPGGRLIVGIRPRRVMEQIAFVQYGFTLYEPEQAATLLTSNGFQLDALLVELEPEQVFFDKVVSMETVLVCGHKR